jgi:hypothetical protein
LRDRDIEAVCPMDAEFALPQWVFGMSTYGFVSATQIVCAYVQNGFSKLALVNVDSGKIETVESPFTQI